MTGQHIPRSVQTESPAALSFDDILKQLHDVHAQTIFQLESEIARLQGDKHQNVRLPACLAGFEVVASCQPSEALQEPSDSLDGMSVDESNNSDGRCSCANLHIDTSGLQAVPVNINTFCN